MKNHNTRLDIIEERICKIEEKSMKIIQNEPQGMKRIIIFKTSKVYQTPVELRLQTCGSGILYHVLYHILGPSAFKVNLNKFLKTKIIENIYDNRFKQEINNKKKVKKIPILEIKQPSSK